VSPNADRVYNFAFRGLLAEEALDKVGRKTAKLEELSDQEIAHSLSLELLDADLLADARKMSLVFVAICTFENSARILVSRVLLEATGENWWEVNVSKNIKERAVTRQQEEEKVRWHAQRGKDPIYYTTLGDLLNILRNNWDKFEPYIHSIEWAGSIFDMLERSRNVIMHSGVLDKADIERVGIHIRDWIKQVGA
jgi:hypothetical protein